MKTINKVHHLTKPLGSVTPHYLVHVCFDANEHHTVKIKEENIIAVLNEAVDFVNAQLPFAKWSYGCQLAHALDMLFATDCETEQKPLVGFKATFVDNSGQQFPTLFGYEND